MWTPPKDRPTRDNPSPPRAVPCGTVTIKSIAISIVCLILPPSARRSARSTMFVATARKQAEASPRTRCPCQEGCRGCGRETGRIDVNTPYRLTAGYVLPAPHALHVKKPVNGPLPKNPLMYFMKFFRRYNVFLAQTEKNTCITFVSRLFYTNNAWNEVICP